MKISKLFTLILVALISISIYACGPKSEKDRVVSYLGKIKTYITSEEYKKLASGLIDASIAPDSTGGKIFNSMMFNESLGKEIEKKDAEFISTTGFKDREEIGKAMEKLKEDKDIMNITREIDSLMFTSAQSFEMEGMTKSGMKHPEMPGDLKNIPGHENLQNMEMPKTDAPKNTDKPKNTDTPKK
jgi:hypothetical protein